MWGLAAAVGVAALITASAVAFTTLKIIGASYLLVLGLRALLDSGTEHQRRESAEGPARSGDFRRGLLTNLLNPKIGVFYSTFLPQFLVRGHSVLLQSIGLALTHNALGLAWLPLYAGAVVRAGDLLRRPRVRSTLDRVTGVVLIGLGVRLAIERR